MQLLSHFLQSSLYFFLPRSSRKNAHSLLRYFGIRGIADTSLSLPIADLLPKRRNAQNLTPLYGFGVILGVFFRYERLYFGGGVLTVRHSKAAGCRFRVTKKRRIATTLLSCSEKNIMLRSKIIFYLSTTGNCLHQFPKNMFLRHPLILHNQ